MISVKKLYECKECGHQEQIETNHYGSCWSVDHFNTCKKCPPFKKYPEFGGKTIWICQETDPESNKAKL